MIAAQRSLLDRERTFERRSGLVVTTRGLVHDSHVAQSCSGVVIFGRHPEALRRRTSVLTKGEMAAEVKPTVWQPLRITSGWWSQSGSVSSWEDEI